MTQRYLRQIFVRGVTINLPNRISRRRDSCRISLHFILIIRTCRVRFICVLLKIRFKFIFFSYVAHEIYINNFPVNALITTGICVLNIAQRLSGF